MGFPFQSVCPFVVVHPVGMGFGQGGAVDDVRRPAHMGRRLPDPPQTVIGPGDVVEGLRKAKLSYCPHHMIEKSWACLLEDGYDY